ncbi:hypothetical protein FRC07_006905 [Ceratobasidium sp. 392]|nr:hypothetical protein FRC07_006905 [Ceratobasidium sp. 392]
MPTLAGWYLSHEDCRVWLKSHNHEMYKAEPLADAGGLQLSIGRAMNEAGLFEKFELRYTGTLEELEGWGLMFIRRSSTQKVYLPPNSDPNGFNVVGRVALKQGFDLDLPVWSVIWWDSEDPEMITEFLQPEVAEN